MNCTEVRQLLSPYFDGELTAPVGPVVAEHVQACADCAATLAGIRSLSKVAHDLADQVPADMWPAIEQRLLETATPKRARHESPHPVWFSRFRLRLPLAVAALAASILIAILVLPRSSHGEVAINLSRYVDEFRTDPAGAEQSLLKEYKVKEIQPDDAITTPVGDKSLAPPTLSDGSIRNKMYLIETPHCKCMQSVYVRPDGGALAAFEHVGGLPAGFGKRPMTQANCSNQDVCLVQCDGQLAASWKQGDHFITLVGVKDLEEVNRLVPVFADANG